MELFSSLRGLIKTYLNIFNHAVFQQVSNLVLWQLYVLLLDTREPMIKVIYENREVSNAAKALHKFWLMLAASDRKASDTSLCGISL